MARLPFATVRVSQLTEYGAAVSSAPSCAPSTKKRTRATPTLSEAVAATLATPETVTPEAGEVTETEGGDVSPGGGGGGSVVDGSSILRW